MGQRKQEKASASSFRPFEHLKSIIERKGVRIQPRRAVEEKPALKTDDEELFREAMSRVREIREFRDMQVPARKTRPALKRCSSDDDVLKTLAELVRGARPVNLSDTQEYVEWVNPLFSPRIAAQLHAGRFSVKDFLDLHGLTLEEAELEVGGFIRESVRRRLGCVKIIHGRGLGSPAGPVLKKSLVALLSGKYRKNVRAFVTARQCDGGLGALYVLLR